MDTQNKVRYGISDQESKRIDLLRLISIVIVVFIHSYSFTENMANSQLSFTGDNWLMIFQSFISHSLGHVAVPIFFIISAVLLFRKQRTYSTMLVKRTKSLIVPYLFWNTLWIVIFYILQSLPITRPFFGGTTGLIADYGLSDWLMAYGLSIYSPFVYPLWFLRDSILMTIISPIIWKLANKFPKITLVVTTILFFMPVNFPFKQALVFFVYGALIVKFNWQMADIDKRSILSFFAVYVIFGLMKLVWYWQPFEAVSIIAGVIFWIKLSKSIVNNKQLAQKLLNLSPFVMLVYVGHELTLSSMKALYFALVPTNDVTLFIQYIGFPIIIIVIFIIIGNLLKKYMPKIYNFVTGAR